MQKIYQENSRTSCPIQKIELPLGVARKSERHTRLYRVLALYKSIFSLIKVLACYLYDFLATGN